MTASAAWVYAVQILTVSEMLLLSARPSIHEATIKGYPREASASALRTNARGLHSYAEHTLWLVSSFLPLALFSLSADVVGGACFLCLEESLFGVELQRGCPSHISSRERKKPDPKYCEASLCFSDSVVLVVGRASTRNSGAPKKAKVVHSPEHRKFVVFGHRATHPHPRCCPKEQRDVWVRVSLRMIVPGCRGSAKYFGCILRQEGT